MSPLAKVQVYPSGQRGRAQDPLHSASQVRILPPAPPQSYFRSRIARQAIKEEHQLKH